MVPWLSLTVRRYRDAGLRGYLGALQFIFSLGVFTVYSFEIGGVSLEQFDTHGVVVGLSSFAFLLMFRYAVEPTKNARKFKHLDWPYIG
jgi:uncharacterized membrane protein YhaH (DUF805 family)